MLESANFLCEIGTEEIPAGYLPPVIKSIKEMFKNKIEENRITYSEVDTYATPRRIVIAVSDMAESQAEDEIEIKGPALKSAYDAAKNPTKALSGFMKGNGVSVDDIFTKVTDKGEYIYARKKMKAKKTEEILPMIMEQIVNNISFPKRMKWSNLPLTFARPISYFLMLFKDAVVPFRMSSIESSNRTRGHYIQFNRMIDIKHIKDYEDTLKANGVIVDHNKRKEIIRKELARAAAGINGVLVWDESLLETVTFLCENPYIVICEFNKNFLSIPEVVLITEMKEHQKYFAVRNNNGSLMSNFLVVSNNPSTEHVKKGNSRVITARFNDAAFFFNEDRKTRLEEKIEPLKNVLFHKELGSIFDKVKRMEFISDYISARIKISAEDRSKVNRAVLLCKTDLNTSMVFEFSSLQGTIGRIYALLDGESEEVANAISDHYKPKSQDDILPDNIVSTIVSISEKLDNIFGSFSVGNIPKGSEDPYALRRQANAVVDILIKNRISIDLDDILRNISVKYKDGANLIEKILDFFSARAKTIFQDSGFRYDEIDACLSIGYYNYLELYRRADSLHEFRKSGNFSEMLLSFKRMNNILSIFKQKNPDYKLSLDPVLFRDDAEKGMFAFFNGKKDKIDKFISSNQYTELFKLLIEGKIVIDNFFDNVMVMADEIPIRDNRLALIENILNPFKNLLDFSRISD